MLAFENKKVMEKKHISRIACIVPARFEREVFWKPSCANPLVEIYYIYFSLTRFISFLTAVGDKPREH